jgi:hypothetical protein
MSDTETLTPEPAPAPSSLVGRMANVFAAPGEVFDEVKSSPSCAANWLVPALLTIVVGWVAATLIFSQDSIKHQLSEITDQAVEKQIKKTKMPEQQAQAVRQAAEKYGSIGMKVSMVAGPVVGAFITPFWWGLILWLLGAKVFKGNFDFMKAVEVAGLSNLIGLLEAIIKTFLILGLGNLFASPSLALFVKEFDPQNTMHSLLAVVNVMTFWGLAVKSIGLARLSGASFGKAAIWVFGLWAAFMGLMIGFGAAMRAVFGG